MRPRCPYINTTVVMKYGHLVKDTTYQGKTISRGHSSYRSRWSRDHLSICSNWIFWPKNDDFMSSNQSHSMIEWSEVYYEIQKVKFFEDTSGLFVNINWERWWEKHVGMEHWGELRPPFGWFLEWPLFTHSSYYYVQKQWYWNWTTWSRLRERLTCYGEPGVAVLYLRCCSVNVKSCAKSFDASVQWKNPGYIHHKH